MSLDAGQLLGWDKTRIRNYGNTELRKRKKG